jgi:hypothetical protein
MRSLPILLTLLFTVGAAGAPATKGSGGKKSSSKERGGCPFVGVADVDKSGAVNNFAGTSMPKAGTEINAFDSEGKVGKLKVSKNEGEFKFEGSPPSRFQATLVNRVLLLPASLGNVHPIQAGKDLPKGTDPDSVTLLLADGSGPKVALLSVQSEGDDTTICDQIACKVGGAWKTCWSSCADVNEPAGQPVPSGE